MNATTTSLPAPTLTGGESYPINEPTADRPVCFTVEGQRVWARTQAHADKLFRDYLAAEGTTAAPVRRPYISAAQDAAAIRAELRTHGWTSCQISVRASSYSLGSSIRVEIHAPGIPLPVVREIATRIAERIDRCPITGEILSGANRYVHVEMADFLVDAAAAPYLTQIEAIPLPTTDRGCVLISFDAGEKRFFVGRRSEYRYLFTHANGSSIPLDTAYGIARSLALESLGTN